MSKYKLVKINDLYRLIDTSTETDALRYSEAQALLSDYYSNKRDAEIIQPILERLNDDMYFYLLEEIHQNRTVLDWIAEDNKIDLSTIKRNKKRLTLIIYSLWEEVRINESGIL